MFPTVTHVQQYEGDEWQPFQFSKLVGRDQGRVHAIKFTDGSVWDTFNGWRVAPSRHWDEFPNSDEDEDEDEEPKTIDVPTLERLLVTLRQTIGRSNGGTVLNMHDKDDLLHFSLEGFLPYPTEKTK